MPRRRSPAPRRRSRRRSSFPISPTRAMEPMNCVVQARATTAARSGTASSSRPSTRRTSPTAAGLKPEQVKINMLFAGGSFGRRANPQSDYLVEARRTIAKAIGGRAPVKLVWTREDDMRGGYYRPLVRPRAARRARRAAATSSAGSIASSASRSSPARRSRPVMVKNGIDTTSVEGASNLPYAIPNLSVDLHSPKIGVPVLWWRSVGSTHTAYSTETFIDELATPPARTRSRSAARCSRSIRATSACSISRPRKPAGARRCRTGSARAASRCTSRSRPFVAQVAEVTVDRTATFKVDRVVCAVDCGVAVNPDVDPRADGRRHRLRAVGGAARRDHDRRTARVEQSNFHDYPLLRINEMPEVEVHIVPSRKRRPASASRAFRRSRRRSRTRSPRRPASACARCRFARRRRRARDRQRRQC